MKPRLLFFTLFFLLTIPALASASSIDLSQLDKLPTLHNGRVKPFSSFAKETVIITTGKSSLDKMSPSQVLFEWFTQPEVWRQNAFLPIPSKELATSLGLDPASKHISPHDTATHAGLSKAIFKIKIKEKEGEELTFLEKKQKELHNRLSYFSASIEGLNWTLIPPQSKITEETAWLPVREIESNPTLSKYKIPFRTMLLTFSERDSDRFNQALMEFRLISEENPSYINALNSYKGIDPLPVEILYNQLSPFHWTWILYGLAFLLLILNLITKLNLFSLLGTISLASGFLLHTGGILLRCIIAGRPPVSNMYESVIWVSWGVVAFTFVLFLFNRSIHLWIASSLVACLGIMLCDHLPAYLDPSITPLVPVLRSNYWLSIHVLTITLSYGALALSMGVAHAQLILQAFASKNKELIEKLALFVYRSIQIGVILLAAGTILGGVWAHYSWGRFWGWDPKETWALIALIGYLIILHARLINWIGAFGLAIGSIIAFLGVVMAWYGVNYVLAAGLHSYGFGGGGLPYVASIIGIDLILVGLLALLGKKKVTVT